MRENRPYGSEGGASQTNGTSLPLSLGKPQATLSPGGNRNRVRNRIQFSVPETLILSRIA
jgi:hypothetical protein